MHLRSSGHCSTSSFWVCFLGGGILRRVLRVFSGFGLRAENIVFWSPGLGPRIKVFGFWVWVLDLGSLGLRLCLLLQLWGLGPYKRKPALQKRWSLGFGAVESRAYGCIGTSKGILSEDYI